MLHRRPRRRDELGETLVEVVVAVAILSLAAVGIVGGLTLSVKASDINRKQTTGGAYVRSYAEAIENYVRTNGNYVKCAGLNAYAPATVGFSIPRDSNNVLYTVTQAAAEPLDGNGSVITSGSCPTRDKGVQRLRLTLTSPDSRAAESITIVVRRACGTGTTCD